MPISPFGFTCTASSYYSKEQSCENVFKSDFRFEWISLGEATESWINISFNTQIKIAKLMYTPTSFKKNYLQHFKDVLFEFSDQVRVKVTLRNPDVTSTEYYNRTMYLKIDPPVLSSFLKIQVLSGYDVPMNVFINNGIHDWKKMFGVAYIQVYGIQTQGTQILLIEFLIKYSVQLPYEYHFYTFRRLDE